MSFDLRNNNLSGVAVITNNNGDLRALPENFTTLYDYLNKYQPELIPDLMYANGKGSILGFLRATTNDSEGTFQSDYIQHAEMNRLHNTFAATATGNNFVSTTKTQLRVKDVVKISNGTQEFQGIVSAVNANGLSFTVLSDKAAFTFNNTAVTVIADFSSRFLKGDNAFAVGKKFDPVFYQNFAQIVKESHYMSDSEIATRTWIESPNGPLWINTEMERISTLFDNKVELTAIFHERALNNAPSTAAGFAQGMKGVVQQVEERGNISNELIQTIADLSLLSLRAKRQGSCREFTVYCGHEQMAAFRELSASVNSAYLNGSFYGAFNNSKDMALNLDFVSIFVDGVQFHFTSWSLMDDPTLMAANGFINTSLAYIMVPTGKTYATEDGGVVQKPYLTLRYRTNNLVNRRRQLKFWGVLGQQVKEDFSGVDFLTEMTNQVIGANNFFVGRKAAGFYP